MPLLNRPFTIENRHGHPVRGDLHYKEGTEARPTVIICHGFKGFKNWGFFPTLADYLTDCGLTTIRFNFSHNGVENDFLNFTRLDLFEKNNLSLELADLDAVLDWAGEQPEVQGDTLGLIGHSRGGADVLIKAFSDGDERIKAVVTWASVGTVHTYPPTVVEQWQKFGFVSVYNQRTHQDMRMGSQYLDDLDANEERFAFKKHLASRKVPLLLIHGDKDDSVPVDHAHQLYEASNQETTDLEIISGGNHTLGAKHPYTGASKDLIAALKATGGHFQRHLLGMEPSHPIDENTDKQGS